MATYPSQILSLHAKYNTPEVIGTMPVNRDIAEGAPLDPVNLRQAEHTAAVLRAVLGEAIL